MLWQYLRDAAPGGALNPEVTSQGALDAAALATTPLPVVGDAVGLFSDLHRYANEPESRTPANYALTAVGMLPFVPAAAGILAGKGARTADLVKLDAAQKMEKAGAPREAIWRDTGWYRGPDKEWRFEIDDSKALINPRGGVSSDIPVATGAAADLDYGPAVGKNSLMQHPELEAAYGARLPQSTRLLPPSARGEGAFNEGAGELYLKSGRSAEESRRTMLHELQHSVQGAEGFAPGGSSDMAFRDKRMWGGSTNPKAHKRAYDMLKAKRADITKPLSLEEYAMQAWQSHEITPEIAREYKSYVKSVSKLPPELDSSIQQQVAYDWYRQLMGEAESRAVEARAGMLPAERAAVPPWKSYDVPWEELIDLRPPPKKPVVLTPDEEDAVRELTRRLGI
jgi:hypothetical protein